MYEGIKTSAKQKNARTSQRSYPGYSQVSQQELAQAKSSSSPATLAALATLAEDKKPLPLRRALPKSDPYPIDSLPPVLRELAKLIIEVVQPPPALVGQSLLAAASLATQAHADVGIDGRVFPLSCYFVTVGESGERKTAVDRIVLKPHSEYERETIQRVRQEEIAYRARLIEWENSRKEAEALEQGLEEALLELGPEPHKPLGGQIVTEEPTYEGLYKQLQNGQPSIGIFSSEGGRFLGGHAMNKENQLKTAAGLSSLWDSGEASRTRSGEGSSKIFGRRCSLHLMLQPVVSSELFSNVLISGQGLLSRCLITYPESTIGSRLYNSTNIYDSHEFLSYCRVIQKLLAHPLPIAEGQRNELNPRVIQPTESAKILLVEFHDHIETLMGNGRELSPVRGFCSKAAENAARLAGVMALVEDITCDEIADTLMLAAIDLIQFYIEESLRLFHSSADDPDLLLTEECLQWAISKGGKFSKPCLYQNGPNKVRDKKTATRIIGILLDHNLIEQIQGGDKIDGKHRKEVWRVRS